MSRRSPLVLAHRGARRDAPENTLLAFERGLAQGADGFELDVRLTADDVLIVLHDTNTRRVAPSQPVLRAESSSYAALAGVELGEGQKIPRLEEALALALSKGALLNIELKHDVRRKQCMVQGVAKLLGSFKEAPELVFLSSFDPRIVFGLARALPKFGVGWLVHKKQLWLRRAPGWPLLGASALHPEHGLVSAKLMRRARSKGGKVYAWTVNEPEEAQRLAALGVDGIITDVPGVVIDALQGAQVALPTDTPEGTA